VAGLDTNILVRWLVDDDVSQSRQIGVLLKSAVQRQETLFVPVTVVLELEWVLRSRYEFRKADILHAMNALLEARELEFQAEPAIERALHSYRLGSADFADCLHAGICGAESKAPMLTFDGKAAKLADTKLLEA
jgi:predicted nucleic-acid-binding protein